MEGNSKPVVLIVENGMAFTGAFKAALQTVEDLGNSFNFTFVIPKHSKQASFLEEKGVKYHTLPFVPLSSKLRNIILYFPFLLFNSIHIIKIIKKDKVQIIQGNDLYNLAVLLPRLLCPKLKLVVYIRLLPGYIPQPIYKTMVAIQSKIADSIVCVSKAVEQVVNINKAIVIYDRPPKEEYNHKYIPTDSNDNITIIYLANYIQGKGQNYALESFAEAVKQVKNLRLIFAGSDIGIDKNREFKENIRQRVRQLNLQDKVTFKDFIKFPEQELIKYQMLLNFSDSESFSFTCLEASYYGLPVIATNSGGPVEIIEHDVTGLVVKKGDIKEMANAIVELAKNEQKRINFSIRAKQLVRERFSYAQTSGKVQELFTKLLTKA